MGFPTRRMRRLRRSETLRRMVAETRLSTDNLVLPLFVVEGEGVRDEIGSMPGNYHLSIDKVVAEARSAWDVGVPAVIVFGLPETKDEIGSQAWAADAPTQRAVTAIKEAIPEMVVMTDICLCQYTSHGHCGVLEGHEVVNDASCELLARTAVSHAKAGADIVAPSDMMDGRVAAIRWALDAEGYENIAILSYAAKYASAFYGPFREAADSAPSFGDRRAYQMDPPNAEEAMAEIELDIEEGADMVMVKPALPYLDIIRMAADRFGVPIAAYNVSGEFAMIHAAADRGWIDRDRVMMETLTSIHRAGARMILTYFARDVAKLLNG
jgi:porphobilinogen synthase